MKKYTILLVTLVLLTSCGSETQENGEMTNELPQVESPTDVMEELQEQTDMIEEQNTEETPVSEATSSASKIITLKQNYTSPAGEELVEFDIEMDGETITNVKMTPIEVKSEITEKRMAAFSDDINDAVVGKTLAEASDISVVGGSSLTTGAFKTALKNM